MKRSAALGGPFIVTTLLFFAGLTLLLAAFQGTLAYGPLLAAAVVCAVGYRHPSDGPAARPAGPTPAH